MHSTSSLWEGETTNNKQTNGLLMLTQSLKRHYIDVMISIDVMQYKSRHNI